MRSSIGSLDRRWIKPLGLVALGIFGIYVLVTGLSGAASPRGARPAPTVRSSRIAAVPAPPPGGATLVGRLDHLRNPGFTAVEVLPRSAGNLLIARLRGLLGMRHGSSAASEAPAPSAERFLSIARALKHARVERDGRFACAGLSPGDYIVIAFSLEEASDFAGRRGTLTVLTGEQRIAPRSDGRIIKIARLAPLR